MVGIENQITTIEVQKSCSFANSQIQEAQQNKHNKASNNRQYQCSQIVQLEKSISIKNENIDQTNSDVSVVEQVGTYDKNENQQSKLLNKRKRKQNNIARNRVQQQQQYQQNIILSTDQMQNIEAEDVQIVNEQVSQQVNRRKSRKYHEQKSIANYEQPNKVTKDNSQSQQKSLEDGYLSTDSEVRSKHSNEVLFVSEFKKRQRANKSINKRSVNRGNFKTSQNQRKVQNNSINNNNNRNNISKQYSESNNNQLPIVVQHTISIDLLSVNQSNQPIVNSTQLQQQNKNTSFIKESRNNSTRFKEDTENVRIRCPICYDNMKDKELAVLLCGHLFCMDCITQHQAQPKKQCPVCRKTCTKNSIRKVFLP